MNRALAAGAIVLGSAALLVRPPATLAAVAITVAAGVVGGVFALPRPAESTGMAQWVMVTSLGVAAFVLARAGTHTVPVVLTTLGVVASMLAAVAEEIFFRRLMYGWLERWGPAAAIVISAVAFALVHVPGYGLAALPIDLAAGLLFGWQRWATGGWTAPALTHLMANLLQLR